ncbi:MAG: CtsR family transcriptional regulator [bacterium]|nr:CtsR family transcriptional regulator [bacterium]
MRMSDIITQKIIEMIDASSENSANIQRNELAALIGCVPSQINYVLSSRFTPEQGFIIESRRGGGGYIRVTRIKMNRSSALMHIINSVGDRIDEVTVRILIENCLHSKLINADTAKVMLAAVSGAVMRQVPVTQRDIIRAAIIKQMFIVLL